MIITSRKKALKVLEEVGCSKAVIKHCLNVAKIALRIAENLLIKGYAVDTSLVEIGALLHDIGRSKTHGILHGVIGGQIAREMDLDAPLVKMIERHIGAGIPIEEAERLGLPKKSYMPETLEEKIVSYADKLVEGDHKVDIEVPLKKLAEDLGYDHPALERLRALHEEIISLIGSNI